MEKITFTLSEYAILEYISNKEGVDLCFEDLNNFFALSDKPDKIDVLFSNRKMKESYFVKASDRFWFSIFVLLSNGKKESVETSSKANSFLRRKYPNGAWVAVEA